MCVCCVTFCYYFSFQAEELVFSQRNSEDHAPVMAMAYNPSLVPMDWEEHSEDEESYF